MYALAADIKRYPEFLPWCAAATIESDDGAQVVASLDFSYGGVRESFTTRNRNVAGRSITMELAGRGPFRALHGEWRFTPLTERSCKIEFSIRFSFINRAMAMLMGPVFGGISDNMVNAFHRRAMAVYGERSLAG